MKKILFAGSSIHRLIEVPFLIILMSFVFIFISWALSIWMFENEQIQFRFLVRFVLVYGGYVLSSIFMRDIWLRRLYRRLNKQLVYEISILYEVLKCNDFKDQGIKQIIGINNQLMEVSDCQRTIRDLEIQYKLPKNEDFIKAEKLIDRIHFYAWIPLTRSVQLEPEGIKKCQEFVDHWRNVNQELAEYKLSADLANLSESPMKRVYK